MVLLVGNYIPDQQQSMQRFAQMMLRGLTAAGVAAELITPPPLFATFRRAGTSLAKWLGYVDKYLLFPRRLRARTRAGVSLVHICDHSNAVYANHCSGLPIVVTCHDLLAVRGALGDESAHCPASSTGRVLQRSILKSLGRANVIACVSEATRADAARLITTGKPRIETISLGLSYPYTKLADSVAEERLRKIKALDPRRPFVLHVGSNLPRKNRDGVMRIFALAQEKFGGQLVFAGDVLSSGLHSLGEELGISDAIVEAPQAENGLLEALYNRATALVYPSYSEGFGWPIAEAQACGCPVICSDRPPLPEVAGDAAFIRAVDDEAGFAADIIRLTNVEERARWSARALHNARRFSTECMISRYIEVYRSLAPAL